MPAPSPGCSITLRVEAPVSIGAAGLLTTRVGEAGAVLTALDVVDSGPDRVIVDLTCDTIDAAHAEAVGKALGEVEGVTVHKISDRTFLMHLGGKLEIVPKVALRHRDDLSRAYTPGVARVCTAIAEHPEDVRRLTVKRNTVAVVTDGSAVLGLGDIGPGAALPVMEGKAALFKQFAGVDAWPVCIDSQDVDEIVRTVELIAPVYGGVNLEDISAPRCFEIERRLRETLDIPVFHDDQHGTAVVVLAALYNALKVVDKDIRDCRIVLSGVGAAGNAIIRLLLPLGPESIIACGRNGAVHRAQEGLDADRQWVADNTNDEGFFGTLKQAVVDADVFIGVSAPNLLDEADIAAMADRAIVFALSNPDPEVDPAAAGRHAAVVATGRSDLPNQINNVLAFPGIFRGLLDAGASAITDELLRAAAGAIADRVAPEQLNAGYIVPSVFDPEVAGAVASAVRAACAHQA
ncbi:NAD-dependent malic enzyme [Yinghuangia seranimata]|uniref:NAD-dependent malic enzyme n=1 Tax=Yinghuangia seranimata TaxID=408067 RepID=UPI00248C894F|nr:NAD-dependent malic enzyme [Yinghuangia seranimata]MDI2131529.1 NAD-dependent malic enzyme [Yinghuangia seranimata]